MQALTSFVQDSGGDIIRSIIAGDHKFVFLVREHLILVCVSRTTDSTQQLLIQLSYLYNQILSVLTLSSLRKIFKQRRNYDLRRQLSGSEKFLDSLLNMMDTEPGHLIGAVRCLPLESTIRDMIAQSIAQHGKIKVWYSTTHLLHCKPHLEVCCELSKQTVFSSTWFWKHPYSFS